MTQSEVARVVGVSQVQVSRIESKILTRFRKSWEAESFSRAGRRLLLFSFSTHRA